MSDPAQILRTICDNLHKFAALFSLCRTSEMTRFKNWLISVRALKGYFCYDLRFRSQN